MECSLDIAVDLMNDVILSINDIDESPEKIRERHVMMDQNLNIVSVTSNILGQMSILIHC